MRRAALLLALVFAFAAGPAFAQQAQPGFVLPDGFSGETSGYIIQLFGLLTVLAVAPGLLIMVTSFTRFVIVFSVLRAGLGLQTTPANMVLVSLALFMTFYVMSPVFDRAWREGVQPLVQEQVDEAEAVGLIIEPFREFMLNNVRDEDLQLFADLARERGQDVVTDQTVDIRIVVPAFMISEIRRGFEMGFLVILPLLVIDLVVATVVMSMGMMMLPPSLVSLPFKILFFVMIDGWNILVGSMVRSVV
jgi:flagellar biosynthetic protein FliP